MREGLPRTEPQGDGNGTTPLRLPAHPLTYEVEQFGNRFRVMAVRGRVRAIAAHSVATETEARATADRLTKRHEELNTR